MSTEDVSTQVFSGKEVGQKSVEPGQDDLCTQIYEDIDWSPGGSGETVAKSSASTDDICTQVYEDRDGPHSGAGAATAKSDAWTDGICSQDNSANRPPDIMSKRMESDFVHMQPYQAKSIIVEPSRISNVVSESAVTVADGKTVEDRDSDNTDDIVKQKSKSKRWKEAAEQNEGKKVIVEDSVGFEVSGSWSATKKSADRKQGRNSKLSSRRTTLMQNKAEAINPDEETKGQSSNDSDQPYNDSPENKRNEKSEEDISEYRNVTKQSRAKQIDTEKIMDSEVSDSSRKSDEVYSAKGEVESSSKALGRRTSMRQNKGKRPEDNEFLRPSEEKRKNKKGSKMQAEELQPPGVEGPNKKICSDPEEAPSKSSCKCVP